MSKIERMIGGVCIVGLLSLTACSTTENVESLGVTDEYIAQLAEDYAASYGITDPPKVEQVRVIELTEWGPTQVTCLQEAGFDVSLHVDGQGIQFPEIDDEVIAYSMNLARYVCEMKYPVAQKYMTPLSDSQLIALYEYRTQDLVQCLKENGFEVDGQPPSEAVFLQSDGEWNPYDELTWMSAEEFNELTSMCPQVRDSIYDMH